jgi:2-polyprenyl-3-methyl-5-hydroxy-6-metoxy-1,4-benzoquinol methylase
MDEAIDPEALKQYTLQVFTKLEGAMTSAMIHLGDRLGLYAALAAARRPITSGDLAGAAGLHERWVREWLHNQAAAKLIVVDVDDQGGERYHLTPEATAVLADPVHPSFGMGMFHRLPEEMASLHAVAGSFHTGVGHDYDSHGAEGAAGIERGFGPWNNTFLVPHVLPAMDGLVDALRSGIEVIDIGCGAGGALLLMAAAFPASRFRGYDISQFALERARDNLRTAAVDNVSFHDPRTSPLPADHSVHFVTTFDCVHDMTRPQQMMASIRAALTDDGIWMLVDIKSMDTFAENVRKNPMASLMYGVSVLSCMSSALSEPGGAGLGTLGLSANTARRMAELAGFSRFRKLAVDHSVNAFYEIRP